MKLLTDNEIDSLPSYPWGQRQDYARAVEEAVLAKLQEPVAYANSDELDNMLDDRTATVSGVRDGYRKTPLYATPVPAIPAGYRLVPLEPTEEMQYAGGAALVGMPSNLENADTAYRAMLQVAPQPEIEQKPFMTKEWLQRKLAEVDDSHAAAGRPCDAPGGCNSHNCLGCGEKPVVEQDDRRDAERYRYIRDNGHGITISVLAVSEEDDGDAECWITGYPPDELDRAIDAMAQGEKP